MPSRPLLRCSQLHGIPGVRGNPTSRVSGSDQTNGRLEADRLTCLLASRGRARRRAPGLQTPPPHERGLIPHAERRVDASSQHGPAPDIDQFEPAGAFSDQRTEKRRLAHGSCYDERRDLPPRLAIGAGGTRGSIAAGGSSSCGVRSLAAGGFCSAGVRNSRKSMTQPWVPRKFRKRL